MTKNIKYKLGLISFLIIALSCIPIYGDDDNKSATDEKGATATLFGGYTCNKLQDMAFDNASSLFEEWAGNTIVSPHKTQLANTIANSATISEVLANLGTIYKGIEILEESVNGSYKNVVKIALDAALGEALKALPGGIPGAVWAVFKGLNDFAIYLNNDIIGRNIGMFARFAESDLAILGPGGVDHFLQVYCRIDMEKGFDSNRTRATRGAVMEYAWNTLNMPNFPVFSEWTASEKNMNLARSVVKSMLNDVDAQFKKMRKMQQELGVALTDYKEQISIMAQFKAVIDDINGMHCITCSPNEKWRFTTRACECIEGYTENKDGDCIKEEDCDENEHWDEYEGACECNDGYTENEDGECVEEHGCDENEYWDEDTEDCECEDGYIEEDGECVEEHGCDENEYWDEDTEDCECEDGYIEEDGECVEEHGCDENEYWDEDTEDCECEDGYIEEDGECVEEHGCDENEYWDEDTEDCECEDGYIEEDGECVEDHDCDENEYWDEDTKDCECVEGYTENEDEKCIKVQDCDENEYWDADEEDCECNDGYSENKRGDCIEIEDCDENEHWDADEEDCECNDGYSENKRGDCIEIEDCDENEYWDADEEDCECNDGYKENENGICVEDKELVVSIALTYPAGQSPKVFTSGWVFGASATVKIGDEEEKDISDQVSWSGSGSFAPSQGSISRPAFSGAGRNKIILSVTVDGQTFEEKFKVRAVDPFAGGYASIGSIAFCPSDAHGCEACPHPVQGPIISGSPNVTISGVPAARKGDNGAHTTTCCGSNTYKIAEGDPSVLINGKPAARIGDKTEHCGGIGKIVTGIVDLTCSENEKWTEDGCECIEGYKKNKDDICIKVKECDNNEHFDVDKDDCVCDDGYTEDENGVCVSDEEEDEEVMDECSIEYIKTLGFMLEVFVAETKLYETELLGYINKFNKEINDQSSDPCDNSIIAYCYYSATEIAARMAENVADIHDITVEIIMLQGMCPDLSQQMQGEGITIKSLISSIAGLGSYKEKLAQMESRLRENGCDEDEIKEDGEKTVPPEGDPGFIQDGGTSTEMPGDGDDNDGDGQQDEEVEGLSGYNVTMVLYDSGSAADDVFSLSVAGYGSLGQTPAGGLRSYGLNLPPGSYTASVTVILAPDNYGTYTLSVLYEGESIGSITGAPPQGSSATLTFTVPSE